MSSNAALSNRWMFYRFLCLDFPVTDAWLCINSYPTVVKRWPTILTNVISAVSSVNHELHLRLSSPDASVGDKERACFAHDLEQGKEIIRRLSGLKHDMGRDRKLEYVARTALSKISLMFRLLGPALAYRPIETDSDDDAASFNADLRRLATLTPSPTDTWFTAPWLFAECYLYRLIRSFFARKGNSARWLAFDPFFESKKETYRQSAVAIVCESFLSRCKRGHVGADEERSRASAARSRQELEGARNEA